MIEKILEPEYKRHSGSTTKRIALVSTIILSISIGNPFFCQAKEPAMLQIDLPKDIGETNFENTYSGKLNGTPIDFTGVPFLKDGTTYFPVRDIANSFDINIEYDNNDRHIKLSTADKNIVISPMNALTVGGSVISNAGKTIQNEQKYMLVQNRSYLPLRYILETLSYSVEYSSANREIFITGEPSTVGSFGAYMTAEQKSLMMALSSFEGASKVTASGKIKVGNVTENIEATITRSTVENESKESTEIHSRNLRYRAERTNGGWATGYSLKEINTNGTERQVNLIGWGSNHPYFYIGDTGLSGIIKYSDLSIVDTGMKDGNHMMKVTLKTENTKTYEVGIDPLTGKIKTLTVLNKDGVVEKELNMAY